MADLIDIRSKVTRDTHAVLMAESHATGKPVGDIVRGLIEPWAEERRHAARVLSNLLRSEGDGATARERRG